MTELERAQADVHTALKRAERQVQTSRSLAQGWAQARRDNNFRAMIRNLVRTTGEAASG